MQGIVQRQLNEFFYFSWSQYWNPTNLTLSNYFTAQISFTLSSHESVPHSKPIKKTRNSSKKTKIQQDCGLNLNVCHSYFRAEFLIYLYWSGITLGTTGSLKDGGECAFKLLIIDYNHILIILWTWTSLTAYLLGTPKA